MGKHFFSHNNIIFSFFLFPFSLWFRAVRCTHILDSTVPRRTATFCRCGTLPRVLFDSLLAGILGSQTFSDNKFFIFWLCESCNSVLACSILQCSLPYTYYADSTNRLCDFRILEFISFLGFCFLPTHGCSAVATGKYPPNTIPNKYFCIKMSHFDYDKHYID